jgi:hypothetical protein
MSDREFLELLNLYVDREISAQDAVRLEAEVAADPRRREVHDQYCRMQKACSMLSEETYTASMAQTDPSLIVFPAPSAWRMAPFVAGMAAAAVVALAFVGLRSRVAPPAAASVTASAVHERARPAGAGLYDDSASMKPVFFVRASADQAPAQVAPLNWIGDIRMAPVASLADADFLMNPKADLKEAVMADPQAHGAQEPVEMAAFRFQR